MTRVTLVAPAKVNLYLRVLGRRPDGFHELLTVLHALPLHDSMHLALRPRRAGAAPGQPDIALVLRHEALPGARPWLSADRTADADGAQPGGPASSPSSSPPDPGTAAPRGATPSGPENLAVRAAHLYLERCGALGDLGLDIELVKRIPPGGGLAGGSSNAAAVLAGLQQILGAPLPAAALTELAAALGSDVAFFLVGGTALCTGRGEIVQAIAPPAPEPVVLLLPPFGTSTPEVYAAHARLTAAGRRGAGAAPPADLPAAELTAAIAGADAATLAALYRNDLVAAACQVQPRLVDLLATSGLFLSGSGSSLFGFGAVTVPPPEADSATGRACRGSLICTASPETAPEKSHTFAA